MEFDVLGFPPSAVVKLLCAGQAMSGRLKKRGLTPAHQLEQKLEFAIKDLQPAQLEELIIRELGYEKDSFNKEHVGRLRGFLRKLLMTLKMDSVEKLVKLNKIIRQTALNRTKYAPPNGAAIWIAVHSSLCLFLSCFSSCFGCLAE